MKLSLSDADCIAYQKGRVYAIWQCHLLYIPVESSRLHAFEGVRIAEDHTHHERSKFSAQSVETLDSVWVILSSEPQQTSAQLMYILLEAPSNTSRPLQ